MALTYTQGQTSTADVLSNRIPIDMSPEISRKVADIAPFTILVDLLPFKECKGRKFEWMEREDWEITCTTTASALANANTLEFANDYKKLRISDMLYNSTTGEQFRVTATPTSSTVTIDSDWPNGTGSPVALGEVFYLIGNAQDENSDLRDRISTKPVPKYNYIQHFRNPFGVSGRLESSELIGPAEMSYLDEDAFRDLQRQREAAYLFSQRGVIGDVTVTGGILEWMDGDAESEQRDMSGIPLTQVEFLDFLGDAFKYGSNDKLLLTGKNVQKTINEFAYDKLRLDDSVTSYGLNIQRFESPDGVVRILRHKLLTELGRDDEAWLIDMGSLMRRGLPGRSTLSLNRGPNGNGIQNPGVDSIIYEYTVEDGLEVRFPERCARLYNVPA